MSSKKTRRSAEGSTRRTLLRNLALALGGVAALPLLSRLLQRSSKTDPRSLNLPGEGSIFQPRRDARLEEWERQHHNPLQ